MAMGNECVCVHTIDMQQTHLGLPDLSRIFIQNTAKHCRRITISYSIVCGYTHSFGDSANSQHILIYPRLCVCLCVCVSVCVQSQNYSLNALINYDKYTVRFVQFEFFFVNARR